MQEWRALLSQQWVKKKIHGSSTVLTTKTVKFSEKSHQKLMQDMTQMRKNRNALFYERKAIEEKERRASDRTSVHPEVKYALFKLIIDLGRKVNKL